ncbi:DUF6114 domain-containing protein [Embleya sp. AB8]|uniref:DUF6114 domain-containing protein n=1 Tax=Embleya sp. AB8 TaxID=3156304 RepID=UPI003C756B33
MTAAQPRPNALVRWWRAFRSWRRVRPFWAGLFTMLAAGPILWAPYASLKAGDVTVQLRQHGGISALFIGVILIMLGIATWLNPKLRIYLGIFTIIVSLVSFIVATFGGFGLGMLFGLIGGMLATSWAYVEAPPSDAEGHESASDDEDGDGDGEGRPGPDGSDLDETVVEAGLPARVLGGKAPDASGEASTGSVPTDRPGEPEPVRATTSPRLALTAIATALVGVVGVVGIANASPSDPLPENPYAAGPCVSASPTAPAGAASSASTSAAPTASSAPPSSATGAASAPGAKAMQAPAGQSPAAEGKTVAPKSPDGTAPQSATPPNTAPRGGAPDLGLPDLNLPELKLPELKLPELKLPGLPGLGLPGITLPSKASSAPTAPPPAASAVPGGQAIAPAGAGSGPPVAPAAPPTGAASGQPSAKPSTTSAKPSAASSSAAPSSAPPSSAAPKDGKSPFPCPVQGPVNAKSGNGLPPVAQDPLVLKSSLLAMAGLNYEGVVKVNTLAGGEENALKFTVSKGIDIWNMSMTVKEAGGKEVVISSAEGSKSWMDADIPTTMYVKYLKGNIFGIIPITFTPESPPPINVPIVFFTNVESSMYAQLGGKLHIPGYGINKSVFGK